MDSCFLPSRRTILMAASFCLLLSCRGESQAFKHEELQGEPHCEPESASTKTRSSSTILLQYTSKSDPQYQGFAEDRHSGAAISGGVPVNNGHFDSNIGSFWQQQQFAPVKQPQQQAYPTVFVEPEVRLLEPLPSGFNAVQGVLPQSSGSSLMGSGVQQETLREQMEEQLGQRQGQQPLQRNEQHYSVRYTGATPATTEPILVDNAGRSVQPMWQRGETHQGVSLANADVRSVSQLCDCPTCDCTTQNSQVVLAPVQNQPLALERGLAPVQNQQLASISPGSNASCTPQCTWTCESEKCDEVCEPVCEPPMCETRCSGIDVSGCEMLCDEPSCAVTCSQRQCPQGGCPTCQATCSEPICKLRCNNTQPCRSLCEHPRCSFECKAPTECAKPKCSMVCDPPPGCMGSTYEQLPPLQPGEVAVKSYQVPADLNRTRSSLLQIATDYLHPDGLPQIVSRFVQLPVGGMRTNTMAR